MAGPETTADLDRVGSWPRTSKVVALVVVGALLVGGATSFAQQVLPHWAAPLANSAGSWTLVTFALVWWPRARLVLSGILGGLGFVLLVLGYALVATWRGFPYTGTVFLVIAVLAGPVIGLAANLARRRSGALRALAGAVPSVVLIGEGLYGLTVIADTTSPGYWWCQIVVGVALAVGIAVRGRYTSYELLWASATVVAGSAAFYVLYAFVL